MINQIAEMVVDNQVSFDDAEKQINAAVAAASFVAAIAMFYVLCSFLIKADKTTIVQY